MKRCIGFSLLITMLFWFVGCASTPDGQAKELRALYQEVQNQTNAICADPGVDPAKCAALQQRIASLEPIVAAVEVAAASTDPGGKINFQMLWASARPKIEAALLDIVLRKYLGAK